MRTCKVTTPLGLTNESLAAIETCEPERVMLFFPS